MKWFLAGLGIGVGLGVVMAPARGDESRRRLREGAERAWDEMSDEARSTLDEMRSSDWARQAREAATQARDPFRNLITIVHIRYFTTRMLRIGPIAEC